MIGPFARTWLSYYYQAAFEDLVLGVDSHCGLVEVESKRIDTWGMTQGGGSARVGASFDRRIRTASAEIAWPLHFNVTAQRMVCEIARVPSSMSGYTINDFILRIRSKTKHDCAVGMNHHR